MIFLSIVSERARAKCASELSGNKLRAISQSSTLVDLVHCLPMCVVYLSSLYYVYVL